MRPPARRDFQLTRGRVGERSRWLALAQNRAKALTSRFMKADFAPLRAGPHRIPTRKPRSNISYDLGQFPRNNFAWGKMRHQGAAPHPSRSRPAASPHDPYASWVAVAISRT